MPHWTTIAQRHSVWALTCAACAILALAWSSDAKAAKWTELETEVYWSTHREGNTDLAILQQATTEYLTIEEATETLVRRIERITQQGAEPSRYLGEMARKASVRVVLEKSLKEKPLSPGEEAQLTEDLQRAFSQIDPETAMTFYLRHQGYSWANTSDLLHMSGFTLKPKHPKVLLETIESGHKSLRRHLQRIWDRRKQENATQRARLQESREQKFKEEHADRGKRREERAKEIKDTQHARALDCCTVWAQAIARQREGEEEIPLPPWDLDLWTRQIRTSELPPHTRLVLLTLASQVDKATGSCTIRLGQLALDTGLTLDALTTHLRIAEKSEFILRTRKKVGDENTPVFQAIMQPLASP